MIPKIGERWQRGYCNIIIEIENVCGDEIYYKVVQKDLAWILENTGREHKDHFLDPVEWRLLKGQENETKTGSTLY